MTKIITYPPLQLIQEAWSEVTENCILPEANNNPVDPNAMSFRLNTPARAAACIMANSPDTCMATTGTVETFLASLRISG